ncbi:MAG: ubiquinone biosynthesis protein COQ4 [Alphaproteobacteria bacterium]|nr:ubiquinone biosynthesis protein COQ4 [Alphaproteobacteria bacterium]MBU2083223.1 ubiquinone biosynthesis protein COQ4 [Alphaproteobacteria bacterium]MBU2144478.1 ubiquinone biosynthesis protein COQ4 [Alphaproteobacteria bacterium]MBU2195507.1 ubiquinone biosynthesis protein COQ4 [Alphaproteobacteria bacterium]
MTQVYVHPDRRPAKFRPLKAWNHMKRLIADKEDTEQVFHIIEALNGRSFEKNFHAFVESPKGQELLAKREFLPPVLDDHEWIRKLPEGTVGRAYIEFMEREGLTAQGLVDESEKFRGAVRDFDDDMLWYGNRLRDTHDLFHVLSGYGRDALGEASLLAFTYSQTPGLGVIFISFMGTRQIMKSVPKSARVMDCFHEGKRNGAIASKIVQEDIVALMHEPLETARKRLRIEKPVAYLKALEICAHRGLVADEIGLVPNQIQAAA